MGQGGVLYPDLAGDQCKDAEVARIFQRLGKCKRMANTEKSTPKRFYGNSEATIDDKGRILVDKKNRDRLGKDFVAALTPTGCLALYPLEMWEAKVEDMLSYDSMNQGREHYTRLMLNNVADELNFDAQGRFVLPHKIKQKAGLAKDIVLNGAGDRLEIWDKEEFDKYDLNPYTYGVERWQKIDKAYRMMKEVGEPRS